jgi:hypothetical protein
MLGLLWQNDETMLILSWKDFPAVPPLNMNSTFPSTRNHMDKYMGGMYVNNGSPVWIRMKISHTKHIKDIINESALNQLHESDANIQKDKIQSAIVSKAGFLLGSIPQSSNNNDLEQSLMDHPGSKKKEFEIRTEFIRIHKGKLMEGEKEMSTRALHIYCAYKETTAVRKLLNDIYGSRNDSGYPLGKKMVFVPNIHDTRFPKTSKETYRYNKAIDQQRIFSNTVEIESMNGVLGLDYVLKKAQISLRQIIMATCSQGRFSRLFLSVDDSFIAFQIKFAFRREDSIEAKEFISAMPLILEASYGREIWQWFDSEAREQLHGYQWSTETGLTSARDETYQEAIDDFKTYEHLEDLEASMLPSEGTTSFEFSFDLDYVTGRTKDPQIDANSHGSRYSFFSFAQKDSFSVDNDTSINLDSMKQMLEKDPELKAQMLYHLQNSMELSNIETTDDSMLTNSLLNNTISDDSSLNNNPLVHQTPGGKL